MRNLKGFNLNCVAFPLGGLGTGNIALAGDGSLRQWQINNNVNHLGHVPSSFFFIQVQSIESDKWITKILEKRVEIPDGFEPAKSINDHIIPDDVKIRHEKYEYFKDLEFNGEYPFAKIKYFDDEIPVDIELEAWNPMIPLDVKNSALPVILFKFKLRNPDNKKVIKVRLGGTLLNFIGWDGISEIDLNFYPKFLANRNVPISIDKINGFRMYSESPILDDIFQGDILFASTNENCMIIPSYNSFNDLIELLTEKDINKKDFGPTEPSSHGKTWCGALINEVSIAPLEEKNIIFLLSWFFPNRYQNWEKSLYRKVGVDLRSKFWLGNRYNSWFKSANDIILYTVENLVLLEKLTRSFHDLLFSTTIPEEIVDSVSATMSIMRSPTCFITKKGAFMGFEGCCGASTSLLTPAYGGSCPMNCTHVWNYAVAVSRLYPSLESSMLKNEFMRISDKGILPHRLIVPTYLPQAHNVRIGGPTYPAMDGLFGCILKTYRLLLTMDDIKWFKKAYPNIKKLMNYIFQECDLDAKGVIEIEQPNTYDISFFGKNTFIGTLYLAALKAFEKMADLMGDNDFKEQCIKRFNNGIKNYDEPLWDGEYWIQDYDTEKYPNFQYGIGCHSDQLFGQFWADMLEFDTIFPKEKIGKALDSIMRYNFLENFKDFIQQPRVFASECDKGLLNCSWPKGGKTKVPALYSDEVWTGIEYEIAALMIDHGKKDNALKILKAIRDRYDGKYRNPWNEVECGDHYVRAMSSWRVYEAAIGYHWNALENRINFLPRFNNNPMQGFFITNSSWGLIKKEYRNNELSILIHPSFGTLELKEFRTWSLKGNSNLIIDEASLNGSDLKDNIRIKNLIETIEIEFIDIIKIDSNQKLILKIKSKE